VPFEGSGQRAVKVRLSVALCALAARRGAAGIYRLDGEEGSTVRNPKHAARRSAQGPRSCWMHGLMPGGRWTSSMTSPPVDGVSVLNVVDNVPRAGRLLNLRRRA